MRELVSPFASYIKDYYDYKILCGYKYERIESVFYLFDSYYAGLNLTEIKFTRDILEPFLELKENERIGNQIYKASFLRQFGKYLLLNNILDNIYLVPPISQKGEAQYIPYIFSTIEYNKIINYIDGYKSSAEYNLSINMLNCISCAFKILMSTGMRLGEVLNLKLEDVNFDNQLFYLKEAKNNNQRLIPFSNTLKDAISKYINNTPFNIKKDDYLLQSKLGIKLHTSAMHRFFYNALKAIGIKHVKGKGPRIHDMRHTFAVMSLTQLQKRETDINLSLSYLSTYLGHKSLQETQKYIWLTPELFNGVKDKMTEYSKFIFDIFEEEKFDEED